MAIIKNFVYCLSINTEKGRTDLAGVLNAMTPEYIPGLFSFSISFALLGIEEGEHILDLKFKDPDNNVISGIDGTVVRYERDENSNLPDSQLGINVAAGMQNVDFKKSGMYSTEVILDGISIGEYPVFAKGQNE